MKRNTKKTLLIGSASLLAVVLGVTVINHTAANGGLFAFRAKAQGQIIESSITFSCSASTYHRVGTSGSKYTFKGTTSLGNDIYLFSDNNYNLYSTGGLVASFGSSSYASKYLSFYSDAEGENSYTFQNIQSISISTKSTSGSNAGFEIYKTISGSAAYTGTISASSSVTVSTEIAGAKYLKLVPTSSTFLDISSITISYSCDPTGGDEPETQLTSIEVSNEKRVYAQGSSFIEPTVTAYYSDSTHEVVSGATFTGFDSSTLTESQTITVSYGGQSTSYTIKIRPTETSKKISYVGYDADEDADVSDLSVFLDLTNSTLPEYANSGSTVTITPAPGTGVSISNVFSYNADVVNNGDGTFSVTVGSIYDCEVTIVYRITSVLTGITVGDSTILEYMVGDEFVEPDVYEVYSNGNKVLIITDDVEFTGFDSSVACESQTITVTYGLLSTTYTITITESSGSEDVFQFATYEYVYYQSSSTKTSYRFVFNSDGTALYQKYQKNTSFASGAITACMYLRYTYTSGVIILTFESFGEKAMTGGSTGTTGSSDFGGGYRLFNTSSPVAYPAKNATTNNTGSYANGVVSIKLHNGSYTENANATDFTLFVG